MATLKNLGINLYFEKPQSVLIVGLYYLAAVVVCILCYKEGNKHLVCDVTSLCVCVSSRLTGYVCTFTLYILYYNHRPMYLVTCAVDELREQLPNHK